MRSVSIALITFVVLFALGCTPQPTVAKTSKVKAPPQKTEEPEPEPPRFPRPEHVRGIYVTAWYAGMPSKLENKIELANETEINSFVIDVRDYGSNYWPTGIPLSVESGAEEPGVNLAILHPDEVMDKIEEAGIYPIARVSCFKDDFVTKLDPERAIQNPDGTPWKERSGHQWLDPYNRENWEYIREVVGYALDQGFPEIQLDYVRFPSEGDPESQRYPAKDEWPAGTTQADVIAEFGWYIAEYVHDRGAEISADIFGIISSGTVDQGIGQKLEMIVAPFDVVSPMVYPSHYALGEYGIANPDAAPFEIVRVSLQDFKERAPKAEIRPWLQDFSLGSVYGKEEVEAQFKAARLLGYKEYLLWNPKVQYTKEAIVDTSWIDEWVRESAKSE